MDSLISVHHTFRINAGHGGRYQSPLGPAVSERAMECAYRFFFVIGKPLAGGRNLERMIPSNESHICVIGGSRRHNDLGPAEFFDNAAQVLHDARSDGGTITE